MSTTLPRVVVVEDERILAMHLQHQLTRLGYDVQAMATSGAEALDHIKKYLPDIVLMDIHIEGDIDGIQTAALIPPELLIPVVYLTAYSEQPTLDRARRTKPYGYLLKPFVERELHATLQMVLERRSTELALRESEKRLRQAQKMEAVGQLTGGIAHDFNNLLAVIVGNLELVDENLETDLANREMVQEALAAAHRGASLTRQLLAYSRQHPLAPRVIDLNKLIDDFTGLLKRSLGEAIDIRKDLDATWPVCVDQNQLENALLNLAVNGRDAMPRGGKLVIETGNTMLDKQYTDQHPDLVSGPYVVVAVTDSGTGMPKELIEKALEPFFTTKPPGRGTGLGLSMVYGFAKQSGGHVKIYSELGSGTTVRIYLPKSAEPLDAPIQPSAKTEILPRSMGGEVVLVVEDDAMVRKLARRLLTELGYQVLEAQDGATALQIIDHALKIDALFTDVILPDKMDGAVLAQQALIRRPELRILYMSGYTRHAIVHNGVLNDGVALLSKPFSKSDLAYKLREILTLSS